MSEVKSMIVHIEMYFEYNIHGKVSQYRCFIPQHLETLVSFNGTASADLAYPTGMSQITRMASTIIDVANRKVVKDRNGVYMEEVAPAKYLPRIVSDYEVGCLRRLPATNFDVLNREVERMMTHVISEFNGEYHFLSNFHAAEFVWDGILWSNSEAAYQAAKSSSRFVRLEFARMETPGEAKRAGKVITMRPDWNSVKVDIMREIVYEKFNQNPELREKLLETGNARLEEGNNWKDTFWGVCPPGSGIGKNQLGEILMQLRQEFRVMSF